MWSMPHDLRDPDRAIHPWTAYAPCPDRRRGADPQKWTVAEVTFLKELDEVYKDHGFPNVEINKILTNKTIDHIKYQRRKLKLASEGEGHQDVAQEMEGAIPLTQTMRGTQSLH